MPAFAHVVFSCLRSSCAQAGTCLMVSAEGPQHRQTQQREDTPRCPLHNIVNNLFHFSHPPRTVAAALSWDFGDDAVVKWGVAKSILKEFCQQTQALIKKLSMEVLMCGCRCVDGVGSSPFSVSFTWLSISSYFASS